MSESPSHPSRALLPLAVFTLAAVRAVPGLVEGWQTDVYARGGLVAFVIWVVPAVYRVARPSTGRGTGFLWMLLALLAGVAGAGTSMRVLDNISLACAVAAIARPRDLQLLWAPLCVSWMIASGWFISRLKGGGLTGWERPALAALGTLMFFLLDGRRLRSFFSR